MEEVINMANYQTTLDWISTQESEMVRLLERWSNINTGTDNIQGLREMVRTLKMDLKPLNVPFEEIELPCRNKVNSKGEITQLPVGKALSTRKHPNAPIQVFLGGHMDTVFPVNSPFQKVVRIDENTLKGPGVADMKAGLIILFKALEALEKSPFAGQIGWEILINPDEEVGSPSSFFLFEKSAQRNHLGLIFEPSFSNGALVSSRKGSANFSIVSKGRAAHAGRDFHLGKNAITALAKFILRAEKLTDFEKGLTINVGQIEGGGPVNIVPDLAIAHLNIRFIHSEDLDFTSKQFQEIAESLNEGINLSVYEDSHSPPKPFTAKLQALFKAFESCAEMLGFPLTFQASGGACDGCRLFAAGLPNLDTLGAIGGHIHTSEEYILVDSLVQRAQLTALFLMRLATQDLKIREVI